MIKGADKGYIKCLHNLSLRLMYDNNDIHNHQDALKYMKMAAVKSCERSMCELGKMLSNDIDGVEKDLVQAKDYFKKSADNDYVDGMFMYLKCAANEIGFDNPELDDAK